MLVLWGLFLCGVPFAVVTLFGQRRPWSLVLSTTFGTSVGLLFTITLGLVLWPGLKLNLPSVLVSSIALFAAGCVILHRQNVASCSEASYNLRSMFRQVAQATRGAGRNLFGTSLERVMVMLIIFGMAARLLNCFDKPFVDWDVLARYALNAKRIYRAGTIVPSIRGYPLLVPLAYVYTHLIAGGVDEHLAKAVPFLFGVMSIVATYALGKVAFNKHVALLSAFILGMVPLHGDRSCTGHVDVPTSFYFVVAALFSYLLWREGRLRHALMGGFFLGCAISTKQAGFTLFISTVAYLLLSWLVDRWTNSQDRGLKSWHLIVVVVTAAAVGLPWYLRNLALGEPLFPVASRWWLQWASPSYENLALLYLLYLAFVVQGLLWSRGSMATRLALQLAAGTTLVSITVAWGILTGTRPGFVDVILILIGLAISCYPLARLARQGQVSTGNGIMLVLIFMIPYYAIWWYRFSYDNRFLLEILPFIAVILAYVLEDVRRFIPPPGRLGIIVLGVAICLIALPGLASALGTDTLTHLLFGPVSDEHKRLEALDDSYRVVLFLKDRLRSAETVGRIWVTGDGRMLYFFEEQEVTGGLPATMEELEGYRYLVYSPWTGREWVFYGDPRVEFLRSLPQSDCCSEIFHSDGFLVFEIE